MDLFRKCMEPVEKVLRVRTASACDRFVLWIRASCGNNLTRAWCMYIIINELIHQVVEVCTICSNPMRAYKSSCSIVPTIILADCKPEIVNKKVTDHLQVDAST